MKSCPVIADRIPHRAVHVPLLALALVHFGREGGPRRAFGTGEVESRETEIDNGRLGACET